MPMPPLGQQVQMAAPQPTPQGGGGIREFFQGRPGLDAFIMSMAANLLRGNDIGTSAAGGLQGFGAYRQTQGEAEAARAAQDRENFEDDRDFRLRELQTLRSLGIPVGRIGGSGGGGSGSGSSTGTGTEADGADGTDAPRNTGPDSANRELLVAENNITIDQDDFIALRGKLFDDFRAANPDAPERDLMRLAAARAAADLGDPRMQNTLNDNSISEAARHAIVDPGISNPARTATVLLEIARKTEEAVIQDNIQTAMTPPVGPAPPLLGPALPLASPSGSRQPLRQNSGAPAPIVPAPLISPPGTMNSTVPAVTSPLQPPGSNPGDLPDVGAGMTLDQMQQMVAQTPSRLEILRPLPEGSTGFLSERGQGLGSLINQGQ